MSTARRDERFENMREAWLAAERDRDKMQIDRDEARRGKEIWKRLASEQADRAEAAEAARSEEHAKLVLEVALSASRYEDLRKVEAKRDEALRAFRKETQMLHAETKKLRAAEAERDEARRERDETQKSRDEWWRIAEMYRAERVAAEASVDELRRAAQMGLSRMTLARASMKEALRLSDYDHLRAWLEAAEENAWFEEIAALVRVGLPAEPPEPGDDRSAVVQVEERQP